MSVDPITIWQIGSEDFFSSNCLTEKSIYSDDSKPHWICLSIKEAIAHSKEKQIHPQIIVLLQQYPDEFVQHDVEAMLNEFPLSRIVAVYGPWCEGDGRNRNHLPLAIRTPISLASNRIHNERLAIQGKRNLLPVTASRDEIFESNLSSTHSTLEKRAVIISSDRIFADCVREMLERSENEIFSFRSISELQKSVGLNIDEFWIDIDPFEHTDDELKQFCKANEKKKLIALAGFDYPDFVDDLLKIGFNRVISKLVITNSIFAGT